MGSNLGRLLRYARGQENEQTENFTTEALAAAVREDPTPLIAALRTLYEARGDQEAQDLLKKISAPPQLQVSTQVTLDSGRRIDFRAISKEPSLQIWIEVKVHSGESGQGALPDYLHEARQHAPSRVVLLGREDLRPDLQDLAFLSWQALCDEVPPAAPTWWRELKQFLEEEGMADGYETPVTPKELEAFFHFHDLFGKVRRILLPVALHLNKCQSSSGWPQNNKHLTKQLNHKFGNSKYFAMYDKGHKQWGHMAVGLLRRTATDGTPDPWLGLWVRVKDKSKQPADLNAAVARLPELWTSAGDTVCRAGRPLREFQADHHQDAIDFLKARIDELKDAGVLALLSR